MDIVFGWHLDGLHSPETISGAQFTVGSEVIGPMGLLSLLEQKLGLGNPEVHNAIRIAQYLARLKEADNRSTFYSRSLETDAWATAQRVLQLRDELESLGCNWKALATSGEARLATLARIEAEASTPLAPGQPERLRELIREMSGRRRTFPGKITCSTPRNLIPPPWSRILQLLAESGTNVVEKRLYGQATNTCDLHSIQCGLLAAPVNEIAGDGSFILAQAEDEAQAAEFMSAWLCSNAQTNDQLVIIRGSGSKILDEVCADSGLPRIGGNISSPWRGALQVLPLMLELSWTPFDPSKLLELLVLPQSPIPSGVAWLFSEALREEPGVDGRCWRQAWSMALERRRVTHLERGHQPSEVERMLHREDAEWRRWLHPARFNSTKGMDSKAAIQLCNQVQRWCLINASKPKSGTGILNAAAKQAEVLAKMISATGLANLERQQLDRLVDAVTGDGTQASDAGGAECSPWSIVNHPGQIWGKVQSVIWWGFDSRQSIISYRPIWSPAERIILRQQNVNPETEFSAVAREAASWRNPILNATERVLMISSRVVAGQPNNIHPLWDEVSIVTSGSRRVRVGVQTIYEQARSTFADRCITGIPVPKKKLPELLPYWSVGVGSIAAREVESSSSIERLIGCPLAWSFEYCARIRPGILHVLPDDERLFASLAHAAIAEVLEPPCDLDPAAVAERVMQRMAKLLASVGSQLLLLGKSPHLDRRLRSLSRSVANLVTLLRNANLHVTACEQRRTAQLLSGQFEGIVDIVFSDLEGNFGVLDLKWTKWAKYKESAIAEGKSIQLAAYQWLQEVSEDSKVLGAGYYMLQQQTLYFSSKEPFPLETYVAGTDLGSVWCAVVDTLVKERNQLDLGRVRVGEVARDIHQLSDHGIKLNPPCRLCSYGNLCGVTREK